MFSKSEKLYSFVESNKNRDLDERTVYGTFIYLAAWMLIAWGVGFHSDHPRYFYLFTGLFTFLSISRVIYFKVFINKSPTNPYRNFIRHINILIPSFLFGLILALSMSTDSFSPLFLYVLMTVFALLSVGSVNFCPDKTLSYSFLFSLTAPALLAILLTETDKKIEGLMLLLYSVYMLFLSNRLSKEYITRISQQFELEELNRQDGLTGLANRKYFDQSLNLSLKKHSRSQLPMSLLLIDIDYFKKINDSYGHATGDQVIIELANQLRMIFRRETDLVARIGGEEFAIILDNCAEEYASYIAETMRKKVKANTIKHDSASLSITVSVGVFTCTPKATTELETIYKLADKNLYTAKRSGRDKVIASTINN